MPCSLVHTLTSLPRVMLSPMGLRAVSRRGAGAAAAFNAQVFLDSSGVAKAIVQYARGQTIFTQGDACDDVRYIQMGRVKLSAWSNTGREAVGERSDLGTFSVRGVWRASRCGRATPRRSLRARSGSSTTDANSTARAVGSGRRAHQWWMPFGCGPIPGILSSGGVVDLWQRQLLQSASS
jgi:hypothetical protein